jgi:hypothetical protein
MIAYPLRGIVGAIFAVPFLAVVGCSSNSNVASDASSDARESSEASEASSLCSALDAAKPAACLLGGPCSCSDLGYNNTDAVCVSGAWACPAGYTRFEECHGVPPNGSCDGGSVPEAGDEGDAASVHDAAEGG